MLITPNNRYADGAALEIKTASIRLRDPFCPVSIGMTHTHTHTHTHKGDVFMAADSFILKRVPLRVS